MLGVLFQSIRPRGAYSTCNRDGVTRVSQLRHEVDVSFPLSNFGETNLDKKNMGNQHTACTNLRGRGR